MIITKRLLPIAAAMLLATSAIRGQVPQPQVPPTHADTVIVTADTTQIASTDTTIIVNPAESSADDNKSGIFIGEGDRLKLRLDNGDIADIGNLISDGLDLAQKPAWMIVSILAIIICVPCVAMIIVLILLFSFLRRRNRDRNELIAKAIDHDYHLPDSFYGRQSTAPVQPQTDSGDSDGTPQPQSQPVAVRNPRTFSNALTLIVVGLCMFLFFTFTASVGVGFITGGIPLFLGIGRMIGYYFVPGFDSASGKRPKYGHMYPPPPANPPYSNGYDNRPPYYNNNNYYNDNGNFNAPRGNNPNGNDTNGCPPPPPGYNR